MSSSKKKNLNLQKKFNKDWNDLHSIRVWVWESYEDTKTISDKGRNLQDSTLPDIERMDEAQGRRERRLGPMRQNGKGNLA